MDQEPNQTKKTGEVAQETRGYVCYPQGLGSIPAAYGPEHCLAQPYVTLVAASTVAEFLPEKIIQGGTIEK